MPTFEMGGVEWREEDDPIWVIVPKTAVPQDRSVQAYLSEQGASIAYRQLIGYHAPERATLHRPSLAPIYGGPTLLEALWSEMDRLMEALMTDQTSEDGGDKYRAQELAWVIAVVSIPYAPSVDQVRAQAVERWNESQEKE